MPVPHDMLLPHGMRVPHGMPLPHGMPVPHGIPVPHGMPLPHGMPVPHGMPAPHGMHVPHGMLYDLIEVNALAIVFRAYSNSLPSGLQQLFKMKGDRQGILTGGITKLYLHNNYSNNNENYVYII